MYAKLLARMLPNDEEILQMDVTGRLGTGETITGTPVVTMQLSEETVAGSEIAATGTPSVSGSLITFTVVTVMAPIGNEYFADVIFDTNMRSGVESRGKVRIVSEG